MDTLYIINDIHRLLLSKNNNKKNTLNKYNELCFK